MSPIAYRPAVDENGEVASQRPLIVEDIAAQSRLVGKCARERFAHGAHADLTLGYCDVPLDRGGEKKMRHMTGSNDSEEPVFQCRRAARCANRATAVDCGDGGGTLSVDNRAPEEGDRPHNSTWRSSDNHDS